MHSFLTSCCASWIISSFQKNCWILTKKSSWSRSIRSQLTWSCIRTLLLKQSLSSRPESRKESFLRSINSFEEKIVHAMLFCSFCRRKISLINNSDRQQSWIKRERESNSAKMSSCRWCLSRIRDKSEQAFQLDRKSNASWEHRWELWKEHWIASLLTLSSISTLSRDVQHPRDLLRRTLTGSLDE